MLKPEPLTAEAFSAYGDVIETEGRDFFMINNGSTRRYHRLADVETADGGSTIISIFRAQSLEMPLRIKMMERHPLGSQAFIPLKAQPFLVLVAAKGDELSGEHLRAFITNGRQGINYHSGVWHHPVLTCTAEDDFLIVDRAGDGNNCDEFYFSEDQQIVLDPS